MRLGYGKSFTLTSDKVLLLHSSSTLSYEKVFALSHLDRFNQETLAV